MKPIIAKIDFAKVCVVGLLLRGVYAGFVHAPVLTGIAVGGYAVLIFVKLIIALIGKIQSRRQQN
jgi:hypothetical protein